MSVVRRAAFTPCFDTLNTDAPSLLLPHCLTLIFQTNGNHEVEPQFKEGHRVLFEAGSGKEFCAARCSGRCGQEICAAGCSRSVWAGGGCGQEICASGVPQEICASGVTSAVCDRCGQELSAAGHALLEIPQRLLSPSSGPPACPQAYNARMPVSQHARSKEIYSQPYVPSPAASCPLPPLSPHVHRPTMHACRCRSMRSPRRSTSAR